jgi:hypothetical protein
VPKNTSLPDWEQVLSAAARLQQLLPEAVLVGGTASAIPERIQESCPEMAGLEDGQDRVSPLCHKRV